MSESYQLKTWNFVRHGLLSEERDHARAFWVIEVELAFLYDFFYTKYYAFFTMGFTIFKIVQLFIVIINWLCNCCSHSRALPYTQWRLEPAYSKWAWYWCASYSYCYSSYPLHRSCSIFGCQLLRLDLGTVALLLCHGKTINSWRRLYKLSIIRNGYVKDIFYIIG